jgi:hypothetical protein
MRSVSRRSTLSALDRSLGRASESERSGDLRKRGGA